MKSGILAICGGIGGAKLAFGLSKVLPPEELVYLVNTGDDFTYLNFQISPDLDTLMYTLAEVNDPERGWGLKNETWKNLKALKEYGVDTWFQLGDKDLATHIRRTQLLDEGKKLSEVTKLLCTSLGVKHLIIPMSESPVRTIVTTDKGKLAFQEYFVKFQCKPKVKKISYIGSNKAEIPKVLKKLIDENRFSGVIICPSNPYLSIDPILSIPELNLFLSERNMPVLAVSPIINNASIKGPTSKIMKEMNIEPSVKSIADHYSGLTDILMVDYKDKENIPRLDSVSFVFDSIYMETSSQKINLATKCLEALEGKYS
ncbi:MAG: 2-phospho-L-lactate transferase [SAR86 cluster bacterium]|jgi:LPPG:FO 2-phospho-L-lactate transferase|nr:2-phospho-L-lactate transferase [SAR86 cluster bacterium]